MENQKIIKALINTKSNYANLNGTYVKVISFLGGIVFCEYIDDDQIFRRCDFSLNEITKIIEFNA
jgi:TnpA family transposase